VVEALLAGGFVYFLVVGHALPHSQVRS